MPILKCFLGFLTHSLVSGLKLTRPIDVMDSMKTIPSQATTTASTIFCYYLCYTIMEKKMETTGIIGIIGYIISATSYASFLLFLLSSSFQ